MPDRSHLSIGEVLSLLREEFPDVTISKIRFLESQGLVDPERTPSGYRKFYEHDVERLRWILRQQREHFLPLKVIKGRLTDDPTGEPIFPEVTEGVLELGGVGDEGRPLLGSVGGPAAELVTAAVGPAPATVPLPAGSAVPDPAGPLSTAGPAGLGDASPDAERGEAPPPAGDAPADDGPAGDAPVVSTDSIVVETEPVEAADAPGSPAVDGPSAEAADGPGAEEEDAAGAEREDETGPAAGPSAAAERALGEDPAPADRPRRARGGGRRAGPTAEVDDGPSTYTADELGAAIGAPPGLVHELEQYGLLLPLGRSGGSNYYGADALAVGRAARRFGEHGIEPRHLRSWRNSADRETSLYEQVVLPLVRQRNPQSRQQAAADLDELEALGGDLRAALVHQALRQLRA